MQIRPFTLVTLKEDWASEEIIRRAPFFADQPMVFLGEIPNMREHGVFVGHQSGKVYTGLHIEQFRELTEEEV